jgi:hypothetical protein
MEDGKRGAVTPSTSQRREGPLRLQQSGGVPMETAMEADRMPHRSSTAMILHTPNVLNRRADLTARDVERLSDCR